MKLKIAEALILISFLFLLPSKVSATVEYAERTGKSCSYCHFSDDGGGQLNVNGLAYKASLAKGHMAKRVFKFIVYYLHFFFAIMWFGTILYVHIILKPGYAAKGLPKGELLLGWTSIVVMSITGIILLSLRFSSFESLLSTSFGIILIWKIVFFLLMVFSAFFVTFILGPKMKKKKDSSQNKGNLEYYDGKDGRRAYIAYKGKVYDVTESKLWKDGIHMMRHKAGTDLTDFIAHAPHKEDVLSRFQEVSGNLNILTTEKKDGAIKLFYVIAYTNLAFVFIIIFLITLWKW